MEEEEKALAALDENAPTITINRFVCASSGWMGYYLAKGVKALLRVADTPPPNAANATRVVGQLAAYGLTALGAPEGALAVLSSFSSHVNSPDEPKKDSP